MLENIKMLLGIESDDETNDNIINYWINSYTKMILKYCHIEELNEDLQNIIEQIVVEKLGGFNSFKNSGELSAEDKRIKSITRGDYSVTYFDENTNSNTNTSKVLDEIAIKFQGQLNLYRELFY